MLPPDTWRAMRAIRLLQLAPEMGLDAEELMAEAGISEVAIDDPDRRLPVPTIFKLWHAVTERVEDPDIGLWVGERADVREAGVIGYAMLHSETTGQAMKRLVRFSRLLASDAEIDLEVTPDRWTFRSRRPPHEPGFRPPTDEGGAMITKALRDISGRQIDPLEVWFAYPRPLDVTRLTSWFRCDLRFDQPRGGMVYGSHQMETPLLDSEERLTHYLDQLAEQELAALPQADTYSRRVGVAVWETLSDGQPAIAQIARELGVSTRTLQRRLREEGTTYAEVIDSLRAQMAPTLLRDGSLAVYEIAYLLGYSDPSAFFRAFRRWRGCSPAEYRENAGTAHHPG